MFTVVKAATPLTKATGDAFSWVAPSKKFTLPVGVPEPGAAAATVAVKVTGWPYTAFGADDVTMVLVFALLTVWACLSFGAVLHEMLTGAPPFHRQSTTDTFSAILDEDPPSLSKCGVKAPASIQKLIRHCLEKKVDARVQTARELVTTLEVLVTLPTGASPGAASGSYRTLLIALAIVAVLVIGFFVARIFLHGN